MDDGRSRRISEYLKALFGCLSDEGYSVTAQCVEDFIRLMSNGGGIFDEDGNATDEGERRMTAMLRPVIVKSPEEDADYDAVMKTALPAIRRAVRKKADAEGALERNAEEMQKAREEKKLADRRKKKAADLPEYIDSEEYEELSSDPAVLAFRDVACSMHPEKADDIRRLNACAAGRTRLSCDPEELVPVVKDVMRSRIADPSDDGVMEYAAREIGVIRKMGADVPTKKDVARAESERLAYREEGLATEAAHLKEECSENPAEIIRKDRSVFHRDAFTGGKNAVQCGSEGEIFRSGVRFDSMSPDERKSVMKEVAGYILKNARRLRTKFQRYISASGRRIPDMEETIRGSLRTGGIPARLQYRNPERKKPKALLLLDISGSCSAASEIMIYFMHCVKECVPGGCIAYAFVSRPYDVTGILYSSATPEEAGERIFDSIPTRGGYSNYGRTFDMFCDTELPKLSGSRVYTFVIGDARNNSNKSCAESFGRICAKSERTIWLNTEDRSKWDTGDSIAGEYGRYADAMEEAVTAGELVSVLERLI